ncbi:MAG: hypothetical protein ABL865_08185 [Candidatus Nitrotoga sp.]
MLIISPFNHPSLFQYTPFTFMSLLIQSVEVLMQHIFMREPENIFRNTFFSASRIFVIQPHLHRLGKGGCEQFGGGMS